MGHIYRLFIYILLLCFFLIACTEKLTPEQEAEKRNNEIIKKAPINIEYKINPPSTDVSSELKKLSGQWVGKWNDVVPSQLVVTDVTNNELTFIYSWGSIPQREIEAGEIKKTIEIGSDGKVKFEKDDVLTTFVLNTILNKVIGAQIDGNEVSNIVMEKVK